MAATHESGCPAASGSGHCVCVSAEEQRLIAAALRPSPAELIRAAKARGLLPEAYAYSASAT